MKLTLLDPPLPWNVDSFTHPQTKEIQNLLLQPSGMALDGLATWMNKETYKELNDKLDTILTTLCFRKSPLFVPGAVIQVKHVFDGRLATYLVGTMNHIGGLCDDCTLDDEDMIGAYAKIEIPFQLG